jgi:parallel beta-helix repeat protein
MLKKFFTFPLTALVVLLAPALRAAESDRVPPSTALPVPGTLVTAADWRRELLGNWTTPTTFGAVEASATGVKLITTVQPEHLYSLQAVSLTQVPLHRGDTLLIRFAARSLQADRATSVTKVRIDFSKASPNWDSSYSSEIGLGSAWQRFEIPFTCRRDFAPREARLALSFGYPAQIAEIADVQVLRFDAAVLAASLPKTKRFADPVPAAVLAAEIARIAGMRRELAALSDPAPAHGRILNVSPQGHANGDGSTARPFATIPQALAVVRPGDTILVAAGEYLERTGIAITVSGRPDAWIKIHAAPGARPKIVSSGWHGFGLTGGIAYVEIEGFELQWMPDPLAAKQVDGVGIAPAYASHHLRFLHNVIHGFGTGGICSLDCDYVTLEGNLVYDTAKTSPYGGSGISLCRAFDFDTYPGYHNVIRGNICHDNELKVVVLVSSGGNGRTLTDGNGIIIDSLRQSRANPRKPHNLDRDGPLLPYRARTLVENNLVYDNGGRGIHVFRSDKVDVINNTTYMNQKTPDINGGEFTAIASAHVVLINNLAYGRKDKRGNTQDGSTYVIWSNNLFYNSDDVLVHDGLIESDPRFVAPALDAPPDGFRLRPDSPALGRGLGAVAPPCDIAGSPRPTSGPVALGAYELPVKP